MLLNRFQIVQLVSFAAIAARPAEERPDADAAQAFLAILFDEATDDARKVYTNSPQSDDPWRPFLPVQFEPAVSVRPGLEIRQGPSALILALSKDETDPNLWSDRGHYVPDPGSPDGAAWKGLFTALAGWDTDTVVRSAHDLGWAIPSGNTRPDELESPEVPRAATVESEPVVETVPVPETRPWYSNDSVQLAAAGGAVFLTLGVGVWMLRRRA